MKSINKLTKKISIIAMIFTNLSFLNAQDITGKWEGTLSISGMNMRLVFNINKTDDGYKSSMDSPDQGAFGIPASKTGFDASRPSIEVASIGFLFEGDYKTDSITGTFKQGNMSFPLTVKRSTEETKLARPQEPKPPFPYRSEDVTFENKNANVTLAGTLTMPENGDNFTAVILISGSGAQNRDEELMGHKPFLVIADYLTRNGIAVLRYDDRGTAQSTGDFKTATTADFATDAESAIAYLKTRKEINHRKIGLMGHSEGGVIAPMVAARSKDVGFIVMLAGTGIRGDVLLLLQAELIARTSGLPDDMIAGMININKKVYDKIVNAKKDLSQQEITDFITTIKSEIPKDIGISDDDYIKQITSQISSAWMQYFLRYDPAPTLEKVKCPVFAVNGSKDLQVPPKENLTAISNALKKGGNKNVTVKEYPNLNHLFQECKTGSPNEYFIIEQTFSPNVLKDITDWILLIDN
jgi:pimeloyl-ACP methyl ester carboxylesterase